jgi:hypothetical protein
MNMKMPLACAFALIAFKAQAQGVGGGLGAGGARINVGLGAGGIGLGVGGGGIATGIGGGAVSAGLGVGGGGVSAGVGIRGVGASGGVTGAGPGIGTTGTGAAPGGSPASSPAGNTTVAAVDPAGGVGQAGGAAVGPTPGGLVLPTALRPSDRRAHGCEASWRKRPERQSCRRYDTITAVLDQIGEVQTTAADVALDRTPLRTAPGTSYATVAACRSAILTAAQGYDPVYATTASGGTPRRLSNGLIAPIETKIVYLRQGGYEARKARVNCRISTGGQVASLL